MVLISSNFRRVIFEVADDELDNSFNSTLWALLATTAENGVHCMMIVEIVFYGQFISAKRRTKQKNGDPEKILKLDLCVVFLNYFKNKTFFY